MDFKSILDNVASKVDTFAKTAAKKTGEVAESAKLAISLKSEQHKLEGMFTTLGKLFYEQAKGTDVRAQVAAQVMEIDEQKKVINDLKVTIAEASGKVICESCGKEIDVDNAFCPVCGKKQEPKIVVEDTVCETEAPAEDTEISNAKPLSPEEFVDFFHETMDKYYKK